MHDQWKDYPDSKRHQKKNYTQQLQMHNVPTDDVENTNGINKGWDFQLINKLQTVTRETERMPKGDQRNTDQDILKER